MSQDSDPITGGLAPRGEASSESDEIVGGSAVSDGGGRPARGERSGHLRPPPDRGRVCSWLIGDARLGAAPPDFRFLDPSVDQHVAGFCQCEWHYMQADDADASPDEPVLLNTSGPRHASAPWGLYATMFFMLGV